MWRLCGTELEKLADRAGFSGPPSVYVDGDYETGNCQDEW
jgi:hypothetical protein